MTLSTAVEVSLMSLLLMELLMLLLRRVYLSVDVVLQLSLVIPAIVVDLGCVVVVVFLVVVVERPVSRC